MSALEVNKILASIIVAIIVVLLIGYIADIFFSANKQEDMANAYKIEILEDISTELQSKENNIVEIEAVSLLLANASVDKGKKIFKKCGSCHTYKKDDPNKVGPNLWNIVNQKKASVNGFAYSDALAQTDGNWNYEDLGAFLYKPKDYIKDTKMNFSGLKKAQDRADLILFLRKQSDNPVPLP